MALITLDTTIIVYTHNLGTGYPSTGNVNVVPLGDAPATPPAGLYRWTCSGHSANTATGLYNLIMNNLANGKRESILSNHRLESTYRDESQMLNKVGIFECNGVSLPSISGGGTHFHGVAFSMEKIV